MTYSEEAFALLVVGLYLFDCTVPLARGQALLERAGRSWTLAFGNPHYVIRGKAVAVLNPLTPCNPAFKTLPLVALRPGGSVNPSTAARAMAHLRLPALLQFGLVLIVIPVTIAWYPGWPFLAGLALAYLNLCVMLVIAFAGARRAHTKPANLLSIAFASIVCLPLSVNLHRRICMSFTLTGDAFRFLRLVPAPIRTATRMKLLSHIEETLQETEEATPAFEALSSLQRNLTMRIANG
jgi:hypothetical protein